MMPRVLAGVVVLLMMLHKGRSAVPAGRSEHAITVGAATRRFVVLTPEGRAVSSVVLLLHGSTRHDGADELSPVRFLEGEIAEQASVWSGEGAMLVYLAGREVGEGSGQFCWGAGTDNNLCTAPRAGKQDESFLLAVLDWLKKQNSTYGGAAVPAYLYGHSGGGRMTWRAACNSTIAQRFAAVFPTSALLAAELRQEDDAKCDVSRMPRIMITHGTRDRTTDISFAEDSVAWAADAAACSKKTIVSGVGQDPVGELVRYSDCSRAQSGFEIAYYRLQDYGHRVPPQFWYKRAWDFFSGHDPTEPTSASTSASPSSTLPTLSLAASAGTAAATTAAASQIGGSWRQRHDLGLVLTCAVFVVFLSRTRKHALLYG
jgi:poly(3-hydroxybutyrate) depolymerase